MLGHIKVDIPKEKWEELRKLLYVEHKHFEGMNECSICDEPLINAAIDEIVKLRNKLGIE